MTIIIEKDIDATFLVETWMAADDPVIIGELKPNGYSFLNIARGTDKHGGIAIISKTQLGLRLHNLNTETMTFEHASILDPNNGVHYIIVYRPPPSKAFDDFLQGVSLLPGKLIILGDFNFHINEPHRSEVAHFMDVLNSFGLEQHVDKPSHRSITFLI